MPAPKPITLTYVEENPSAYEPQPFVVVGEAPATAASALPPGGSRGQHLRKRSNADYDTEWSEAFLEAHGDLNDGDISLDMGIVRLTVEWDDSSGEPYRAQIRISSVDGVDHPADLHVYVTNAESDYIYGYDSVAIEDVGFIYAPDLRTNSASVTNTYIRIVETGELWEIRSFFSGLGTRCSIWADRME